MLCNEPRTLSIQHLVKHMKCLIMRELHSVQIDSIILGKTYNYVVTCHTSDRFNCIACLVMTII